jgi:hypothetical protein
VREGLCGEEAKAAAQRLAARQIKQTPQASRSQSVTERERAASVTFYLPFQAPFDSSGIRFAEAKNKKYISREARAPQKWFLLSARESISKPIVSGAILSARDKTSRSRFLSFVAAA